MPLAKGHASIDGEFQRISCQKGDRHVVSMGEGEVAHAHAAGERYSCSCKQAKDMGTR